MITPKEEALADRIRSVRCKLNNQISRITVPVHVSLTQKIEEDDLSIGVVNLSRLKIAAEKMLEADVHLKTIYDDLTSRRYE